MIKFEKMLHANHIVDEEGKVLQEGTILNAELLNRYEAVIEELVKKVNELEGMKENL